MKVTSGGKIMQEKCELHFLMPKTEKCNQICVDVQQFKKDENIVTVEYQGYTDKTMKVKTAAMVRLSFSTLSYRPDTKTVTCMIMTEA